MRDICGVFSATSCAAGTFLQCVVRNSLVHSPAVPPSNQSREFTVSAASALRSRDFCDGVALLGSQTRPASADERLTLRVGDSLHKCTESRESSAVHPRLTLLATYLSTYPANRYVPDSAACAPFLHKHASLLFRIRYRQASVCRRATGEARVGLDRPVRAVRELERRLARRAAHREHPAAAAGEAATFLSQILNLALKVSPRPISLKLNHGHGRTHGA
eukprot:5289755-Pleurochrysis_carterae.AAC.2